MKNMIVLTFIGAALTLSACGKSDLEKKLEEGTETSKQMAGTNRPIPVPNLEPDAPQPKKNGSK